MAGKCPKRALKWYLGGLRASKIPYNTHFGARAIKMAHLGGSGTSCSAFYGGPYGKGKTPFYKKNYGNSRGNGVFARGPGAFLFLARKFVCKPPGARLWYVVLLFS